MRYLARALKLFSSNMAAVPMRAKLLLIKKDIYDLA